MFFVRGIDCPGVAPHEYGHGIQHLWWGPLFPFVIGIPSAARYWLREQKTQKDKKRWTKMLYLIITIVCIIICNIGLGWTSFFPIMGMCLFVYGSIICGWLYFMQIPQYESRTPRYDDIWFEG